MDFGKLNENQKAMARMIAEKARANNVDPELALAIGFAESKFINQNNPDSGAMGIMQVMPSNAKGLGIKVEDLADPAKNIDAGIRILKENLDRYKGDAKLAAIAYNSRPLVADRYAKTQDSALLPEETENYWQSLNNFRDLSKTGYLVPVEASATQAEKGSVDMGSLAEELDNPLKKSTLQDMYLSGRMAASGPDGEIDKLLLTGAGATAGALAGTYEAGSKAGSKIMNALKSTKEAADAARCAQEASLAATTGSSPDSAGQKW
jgi:hypothetical protein